MHLPLKKTETCLGVHTFYFLPPSLPVEKPVFSLFISVVKNLPYGLYTEFLVVRPRLENSPVKTLVFPFVPSLQKVVNMKSQHW